MRNHDIIGINTNIIKGMYLVLIPICKELNK